MVKGQIEERISKLKQNFKQPTGKVLQNADVKARLSDLYSKHVFVPADKAPDNIRIICKRYHIMVVLLAGPISHTSTRYMDFVEIFNIILDLSITCFSHFSGC